VNNNSDFKQVGNHDQQRRESFGGGSVTGVNDQADRIQAYTNNSLGVANAMKTKLSKLRHPSS